MSTDLKKLGIALGSPELVEEHYERLRGILTVGLTRPNTAGLFLNLDDLPSEPLDLKAAVIKWLIGVNLPRIRQGQDPVVTLELALKCPVWRLVKPPVHRIKLTKEGMFNKPGVKTVTEKEVPGTINK